MREKAVRYENPIPFTLWAYFSGYAIGWAARWAHRGINGRMVVIKLLSSKPIPVPTPSRHD